MMKIYKIIALAFVTLLCVVGIIVGVQDGMFFYGDAIRGKVIIVAFLIILLKTIGSFIEAIVDCNKYYVDKRKKEIDKQIAYEKFLNQQASNHVANSDQSQKL